MSCFSLAFWENLAVDVVILIAVVALLRLLIAALGGGAANAAFWPPVRSPWTPGGPAPAGLLGFIAAALEIVIWAMILIFVIWVIFALLSCLLGPGGFGFGWRPLR